MPNILDIISAIVSGIQGQQPSFRTPPTFPISTPTFPNSVLTPGLPDINIARTPPFVPDFRSDPTGRLSRMSQTKEFDQTELQKRIEETLRSRLPSTSGDIQSDPEIAELNRQIEGMIENVKGKPKSTKTKLLEAIVNGVRVATSPNPSATSAQILGAKVQERERKEESLQRLGEIKLSQTARILSTRRQEKISERERDLNRLYDQATRLGVNRDALDRLKLEIDAQQRARETEFQIQQAGSVQKAIEAEKKSERERREKIQDRINNAVSSDMKTNVPYEISTIFHTLNENNLPIPKSIADSYRNAAGAQAAATLKHTQRLSTQETARGRGKGEEGESEVISTKSINTILKNNATKQYFMLKHEDGKEEGPYDNLQLDNITKGISQSEVRPKIIPLSQSDNAKVGIQRTKELMDVINPPKPKSESKAKPVKGELRKELIEEAKRSVFGIESPGSKPVQSQQQTYPPNIQQGIDAAVKAGKTKEQINESLKKLGQPPLP